MKVFLDLMKKNKIDKSGLRNILETEQKGPNDRRDTGKCIFAVINEWIWMRIKPIQKVQVRS